MTKTIIHLFCGLQKGIRHGVPWSITPQANDIGYRGKFHEMYRIHVQNLLLYTSYSSIPNFTHTYKNLLFLIILLTYTDTYFSRSWYEFTSFLVKIQSWKITPVLTDKFLNWSNLFFPTQISNFWFPCFLDHGNWQSNLIA